MKDLQLDFKVSKNFLRDRLDSLERFTCKQEKETLLLDDVIFSEIYQTLVSHLDNPPEPLNEMESLAFIIKLSEISVSDIYTQMFECASCKLMNEVVIELEHLINTDFESEIPIGLFETPDDIINNADSLIVSEYNRIQDIIQENNEKILDLIIDSQCRSCRHINKISVNPTTFISKVSLAGYYEECFGLSFYSHISPSDVEKMYPFERSLYLGLTKKKIETSPAPGGF